MKIRFLLSTRRAASAIGTVVAAPIPVIVAIVIVIQAQMIIRVSAFVVVIAIVVPTTMAIGAFVQMQLSVLRQISVQLELKQMIDGCGAFFGCTALARLLVRRSVAFHVWYGEVSGAHPTIMFEGQPSCWNDQKQKNVRSPGVIRVRIFWKLI